MNGERANEIERCASAEEGQFFERKSALDRSSGRPKRRKAADIARDVAETLSAMANADGGELVIGIEDDRNSPFPAERIAALKAVKSQGLIERGFPAGARINDLDLDLVRRRLGPLWPELSAEETLVRYGLVAARNGHTVPTLAALLLFGSEPTRWHPRCGIDFVRWEGTERKHGAELNVTKRIRIESPLAVLIEDARKAIQPFIRERQQLHDLLFVEKLEYPTFAWQEAIVNAVAHRDYSLQGAPIEVWMFDDRMEIRSPGLPPAPVTIETLNQRKPMHQPQNASGDREADALTAMKTIKDLPEHSRPGEKSREKGPNRL